MSIREIHRCEACGTYYGVEKHHVVFKKQNVLMVNIELNFKYLCSKHHRGDDGPHKNRYVDLTYKLELQDKLFKLFNKDFYTEKEIRKKLNISSTLANKICKKLRLYKSGYNNEELVRRLMGDRLYITEELEEFEYENPFKRGVYSD